MIFFLTFCSAAALLMPVYTIPGEVFFATSIEFPGILHNSQNQRKKLSFLFHFSTHITTPEDLELLMHNKLTEITVVVIKSPAHPNVLSLPALFANRHDIYRIIFSDEYKNCVIMEPRKKTLEASFWSGRDLTLGFPTDYESYRIRVYKSSVTITDNDLDFIVQLKNVKTLRITASSTVSSFDVAERLLGRVSDLKQMPLVDVSVSIFPHTEGLPVKELLEEVQSLKTLSLDIERRLSVEEIFDIIEREMVPDGWHVSTAQFGQIDYLRTN